jgi:hypothetical protein
VLLPLGVLVSGRLAGSRVAFQVALVPLDRLQGDFHDAGEYGELPGGRDKAVVARVAVCQDGAPEVVVNEVPLQAPAAAS